MRHFWNRSYFVLCAGYMHLIRVLISSLDFLCPFRLSRVINLVLVLLHFTENCSTLLWRLQFKVWPLEKRPGTIPETETSFTLTKKSAPTAPQNFSIVPKPREDFSPVRHGSILYFVVTGFLFEARCGNTFNDPGPVWFNWAFISRCSVFFFKSLKPVSYFYTELITLIHYTSMIECPCVLKSSGLIGQP